MQDPNPNQSEVSLHAIDYWQVLKNRYGVILLTFLLVFLTAAVITQVMPEKYESKALVEVRPINYSNVSSRVREVSGPQMTRQFFNTQFEVIVANENLSRAIELIALDNKWSKSQAETLLQLRSIIDTRQRRGTDLIEISVRYKNKAEAKIIAQAVVDAYEAGREAREKEQRVSTINSLDKQLQSRKDRVQELRSNLMNIADRVGVVYIEDERGGSNIRGQANLIDLAQTQLYEVEREKEELSFQITQLLSLEDEQLIKFVSDLPDTGMKGVYDEYMSSKRSLESLKASGLGAKHPEVRMLERNISELKKDLESRTSGVRELLQHRLTLIEGRVNKMKSVVDSQGQDERIRAREVQEFNNARREYKSALEFRNELELKVENEKASLMVPPNTITIHERPVEGMSPVSPNVVLNLGLGAVVGLIFGVGIAFFLEFLDTSVKSLEDVERYLNVPVLAVVPKDVGVLHKQGGMSPDAEAYRILRTNIEFNRKNPEDNSITVVSGGAGEGKSTTMVNLAYICAQGGYTTLMIDADLRRPRLHTFFDINNSVGLTNYLTTDLLLEDVILQTPIDNLYFMPSGVLPADAAGILNSRRMSELILDVKQRFDLVLVDSPPILGVSDASVLASEVDLTMIVVQHRKLPRQMLMRVKQAVENVGGQVIGVVLNNVDVRSDSQYQYYTSYYTYYAPTTGEEVLPDGGTVKKPAASASRPAAQAPASNDEDLY
ncbi:GumC family protein [Persicirhabdus sediminis]|uniref:Polysaccharide biosynthesis tyrosine autokinase n=1 Tax=Persicirhabdus sediminis TaxID=454144 RepID=A0A8J7MDC8_9BACT|nr:polysaccharide biosynthesis tyrosine autokinase [Persicirhabdus sediminis]MBK1790423.1 polysaccharide biosynthesis tyrosine autokinase [Persicirhabdus sediminis]